MEPMNSCDNPKPFRYDYSICDGCGGLLSTHPSRVQNGYVEYREALWRVMLTHGGIDSFYGSYDKMETLNLRQHFNVPLFEDDLKYSFGEERQKELLEEQQFSTGCFIDFDWDGTSEPYVSTAREFVGTFAEDNVVEAVKGTLTCVCREYDNTTVVVKDIPLGRLIWLAVKAGTNYDRSY